MNINKYELKSITFKANIDFCVNNNDWRKATITKFYLYNNKIYGLVVLSNGQEKIIDLESSINNGQMRVNNCKDFLPEYIKELHNKNITPIYKDKTPKTPKKRLHINEPIDDIEEIMNYLHSRKVASLIHFSPICNLDSILKNGICSREYCETHNIKFQHSDEERFDNLKHLISLSISFPNYKMRFKKEKEINQHFIIIEIDPSIIKNFGIKERRFCYTNASTKFGKFDGPNLTHLQTMFPWEELRKERNLPLYYTTDPQAEVLLKGPIPTKYIKKIHFDNNIDFSRYSEKYHSPLFVEDRTFFKYREDYAYHQKQH